MKRFLTQELLFVYVIVLGIIFTGYLLVSSNQTNSIRQENTQLKQQLHISEEQFKTLCSRVPLDCELVE